jgi:hypothetical protein
MSIGDSFFGSSAILVLSLFLSILPDVSSNIALKCITGSYMIKVTEPIRDFLGASQLADSAELGALQ